LAIGKEGLNARLAARLTGWKVDIQSEAEFAQSEAEAAFAGGEAGEDFSGRCAAILSNGKRCPNAAIPGTRFCGIPAHTALADREAAGETIESAEAVPIAGAEEDEELLADGDVTELPTPEPSEVPSPEPSEVPSPEPSPTPSVPQPTEVPTPEPATIPTPEPSTVPGPEPASVPPMPAAAEEPEEAPLEERPSGIPIAASAEVEEERNDAPAA
jgi:hypothetical protein